jgi:2-oxo-4-hydroxy-4-carboxy-5-ureidoimidazoline decarboxylase
VDRRRVAHAREPNSANPKNLMNLMNRMNQMNRMTLAELNARDRDTFVEALGWIFEDSPWVAERAWPRRPFASLEALHQAMIDVVQQANETEQLALLCAHPDLGTRARISDASTGEQRGAGLDRLDMAEYERLQRLNGEYRRRFGFPFLFAIKGSTKEDVLTALELRVGRSRDEELAEALRQVFRIAGFRLEDVVRGSSGTTG